MLPGECATPNSNRITDGTTLLYCYFLVAEQCGERLGMHTDRLVGFVKDGKVEFYAGLSCCRSQLGAALIGREYDLRSSGLGAKQHRDLFGISVRGQT
jgi:hypothetical protein